MEFRINPSLLRLLNISKNNTTSLAGSKYIIAVVSQNENVTVRNSSGVTQERCFRSISAFGFMNNSQCYPKVILKNTVFMKLLMQLMTRNVQKSEVEEDWGGPEAFKLITFIKDDFDVVVKQNASVMVFFSAVWCRHCQRLRKPYGTAALMSKKANLPMIFATFDVNYNPDLADAKGVVGIPLIKYYKNGNFVTNYKGKRTASALFEFAKNPPEDTKPSKKPDI